MASLFCLIPRIEAGCWLLSICVLGCAEWNSPAKNEAETRRELAIADLASKVQISKGEPPTNSIDAGGVETINENYQGALMALKVKAARRGANYVVLDTVLSKVQKDSGGIGPFGALPEFETHYQGRAFSCGPDVLSRVPGTPSRNPSPATICEPECSPGYVCLRARCVSACNPPCAPTERCGADRICTPVRPAS